MAGTVNDLERNMKLYTFIFTCIIGLSIGCGGSPEKVDREGIQKNADDAHRSLDRNRGR
jgi:hypothetical protein